MVECVCACACVFACVWSNFQQFFNFYEQSFYFTLLHCAKFCNSNPQLIIIQQPRIEFICEIWVNLHLGKKTYYKVAMKILSYMWHSIKPQCLLFLPYLYHLNAIYKLKLTTAYNMLTVEHVLYSRVKLSTTQIWNQGLVQGGGWGSQSPP